MGLLGAGCGTTVMESRGYFYDLIKRTQTVFAHTSNELAEAMTVLHQDDLAVSSKKFIGYCDKPLQKGELWASCFVTVSEYFLNGTSAQLGNTVPFKLDVVEKI